MDYRREIDGLRALAVLPVMLFHAGFETFSGGFVGVDIFFIISGYLITTIILAELEQGKFSIVNFYERRARRILPPLFLVMLICTPFALFWLSPSEIKDFSQSLVAVSVFASNFLFWTESGYFDVAAELKPLLHTWSLAVEEQYYILFPLFLMLFWKLGKRWILLILGMVFLASFALAEWGSQNKPSAAFFLLPTRIWELLAGTFSAFYLSQTNRKDFGRGLSEVAGWLGVTLIMCTVFAFIKATPFPGFYALFPALGTVLIILFATQRTTVGKLMGHKVLVGIGLISYSTYLWHQPLFAFARNRALNEPGTFIFLFLSIASLFLGFLSYRYIESLFRNKTKVRKNTLIFLSILLFIFFVALGFIGHFKYSAVETYWLKKFPDNERQFYSKFLSTNYENNGGRQQNLTDCRFNIANLSDESEVRIRNCEKTYGSGILILGDSHAIDLFWAISSRFDDSFLIGVTSGGCRAHTPRTGCQYDRIISYIEKNPKSFKHIIYEQAGFYLLLDSYGRKGARTMFSSIPYDRAVEGINVDMDHIQLTLNYILKLSNIVPVTWFLPRIEHHINPNFFLKNGCNFSYELRPNLAQTFINLDAEISKVVDKLNASNIRVMSQNSIFDFDFSVDLLNCKDIFWRDGDHFSASGEARFGARLPANFLEFGHKQ